MATVSRDASCNPSSISVTGKTNGSGTISWSLPTVPAGGVISSCKLTGTCTITDSSKKPATVTVNGTSVSSGVAFTINLGTENTTPSVAVTATGPHKNTKSTITFSNLVYTVDYETNVTYTVTFKDWDGNVLKTETVKEGSSATAPSDPIREGYKFIGWDKTFSNVTSNLTVTAQYSIKTYIVTFKDHDGTTLKTQTVTHGNAAIAPSDPTRDGYDFTGWDKSFNNIISNLTVTAQYTQIKIEVIELDTNNIVLGIGETATVQAHISPAQSIEKVKWSVNNNNVLLSANNMDDGDDEEASSSIILYYQEIFPVANNCTIRMTNNSFKLTSFSSSDASVSLYFEGLNPSFEYYLTFDHTEGVEVEIRTEQGSLYNEGLMESGDTFKAYILSWNTGYTFKFYHKNGTTSNWEVTNLLVADHISTFATTPIAEDDNLVAYITGAFEGEAVLTCSNQDETIISTCNITVKSEEPEDEIIEWTGLGTIATGLRAHDVEHSNYKINIDWDTQYFDIIVTEEFNYLYDSVKHVNIASLDKIKIGNNIYEATLFVTDNIDISIYGPMDEAPNYTIERNYPYTIRLAKEGIYVLYGTTSHLIMERDYDLDTIYFNEDGRDNKPLSNTENGDYDVAFDLMVSEYSEEPSEPSSENLFPKFNSDSWAYEEEHEAYLENKKEYDTGVSFETSYYSIYTAYGQLDIIKGKTVKLGVSSIDPNIYIEMGEYRIDNSTLEVIISVGDNESYNLSIKSMSSGYINGSIKGAYLYIIDDLPEITTYTVIFKDWDGTTLKTQNVEDGASATAPDDPTRDGYVFTGWDIDFSNVTNDLIVTAQYEKIEEPDNNELVQGDINDESGAFEDEVSNVVKTKYIDVSDKKQILVNVLTEDVYILKCYLYNANKELVKIIDISADKKRMFGLDLQKLIEEVMNDGNE